MILLTLGGMVLIGDRANIGPGGTNQMLGLLAVMVATAAWGVDNTSSRTVAGRDPGQVVMFKGALGAVATMLMALFSASRCRTFFPHWLCSRWARPATG